MTTNLDQELADILLELTGSTPSGNLAVSLAYQRLQNLITTQKQELKELLATPPNKKEEV